MPEKFPKKRLSDLDLEGRRLLLRVDLNTPLERGAVGDDSRIRATLPGIRAAHHAGAAVVLASHLGRPRGRPDAALSLRPATRRLEELLGRPVDFSPAPFDSGSEKAAGLSPGQTLLLENLRYHPGEEDNCANFAAELAAFGDEYANDAFGAAHRDHASVDACARLFPQAAAGPLMEAELRTLGRALTAPARPFVAILGGAKITDKLPVIRSLVRRADAVLIGGAMAYTFFAARGLPTGESLLDPGRIGEAADLLREHPDRLILPSDHLTAPASRSGPVRERPAHRIAEGWQGLDIGPASRAAFAARIGTAATVVWNGPMGLFEDPRFAGGTAAVAQAVAAATRRGATTIVGGGDSLAAIRQAGLENAVSHLSTGGGASLALLAGNKLPGVEALADA